MFFLRKKNKKEKPLMEIKNKFGKQPNFTYEKNTYDVIAKKIIKKSSLIKKNNKEPLSLLFFSDLHNTLKNSPNLISFIEELEQSKIDTCIILGDISYDDLTIIKNNINIPIYGLLGNHNDFNIYTDFNITNINGKKFFINDYSFLGIEGSFKYKDVNFPSFTQEESIDFLAEIDYCDILLSHNTPYMINEGNISHRGLIGILKALTKKKIPYNIHGHIHRNNIVNIKNGTKSISFFKMAIIIIKEGECYVTIPPKL